MANMRMAYKGAATLTAVQLHPTQITSRHITCMKINGTTRSQSTCGVVAWPPPLYLPKSQPSEYMLSAIDENAKRRTGVE